VMVRRNCVNVPFGLLNYLKNNCIMLTMVVSSPDRGLGVLLSKS